MTLGEMLALARVIADKGKGTTRQLAAELIRHLGTEQAISASVCPTAIGPGCNGSVHVPREANGYYTPEQARAFALEMLRQADIAEAARKPR